MSLNFAPNTFGHRAWAKNSALSELSQPDTQLGARFGWTAQGGGSKFTQHIDNTARDGRRLTVLCYLNREDGHTAHEKALFPKSRFRCFLSVAVKSELPSFDDSRIVAKLSLLIGFRFCSVVLYDALVATAGDSWQEAHGGALRVHSGGRQGAESAVRVLPVAGRLAMFYADSMPHEVEESWRERHALTMWYYDKLERAEALETAKIAGGANAAAEERERQEAQTLIRAMMAADPAADPTAAECAELGRRVKALSPAALQIVSSIVGAPSASHFQEAADRLTPSELKKLRQDFSTMKA